MSLGRWLRSFYGLWPGDDQEPALLNSSDRRGRDRLRRATRSGFTSLWSTAIATGVSLLAIPLTVGYLGVVRYGVWLTISSLLSWLSISNMGFGGAALINALSEAHGREDVESARSLVSTAFFSLCGIALFLLLVFSVSCVLVPWGRVFNVEGFVSETELMWAIAVSFVCFVTMFPMGLLDAVYAGYQEMYLVAKWNIAANLASLMALVIVTQVEGGLPLLVLAFSGTRMFVMGISLMYLFLVKHPEVRPKISLFSKNAFKRLFDLGWRYLVQQIAGLGMFQTQPILITHLIGPGSVGIYNIVLRVVSLPLTFVQFFTYPMLPAYGEARARNDWPWIWQTLKRSVIGAFLVVLVCILPVVFGAAPLIRYWAGNDMVPSIELTVLLALYVVINAAITPVAVFFSGIEWVGSQATIAIINALVSVCMALCLLPWLHLPGMALAMLCGILVNGIGQGLLVIKILRGRRKAV